MTVSQLIEELQKLPQDIQVIISKDYLNNDHSPLDEITVANYIPDGSWQGEARWGEDVCESEINAVLLFPVD